MRMGATGTTKKARQMRRDNNCNPQGRQGNLRLCQPPSTGSSTRLLFYNWLEHCSRPATDTDWHKYASATTHRTKAPKCQGAQSAISTRLARNPAPSPIEARHTHTEDTRLMGKPTLRKGELKSIYLTRIRLTKKKKRMCEHHSQAPPTLASPKLERGREKGALRLNCEHELPSPLVQRYPEPTRERGKELLCDGAMSCGEAQSKECPTVDVPNSSRPPSPLRFNRHTNLTYSMLGLQLTLE